MKNTDKTEDLLFMYLFWFIHVTFEIVLEYSLKYSRVDLSGNSLLTASQQNFNDWAATGVDISDFLEVLSEPSHFLTDCRIKWAWESCSLKQDYSKLNKEQIPKHIRANLPLFSP